jgi:hypothetical protein
LNLSKKYFSKPKAVARESDQEILEFFHSLKSDKPYLELPEELYEKMEPAHGIIARDLMEEPRFVKLPKSEIRFFEWLKEKDGKVWNDLWGGDSNVYLVSLAFLPMLFENDGRGYPICDLETIENYYFMETHMVGDEGKTMMETSQKLFLDQKGLTIQQLLALEISIGPIDIWHFAYKHGMDIEKSKEAAREMADDGLLVHLTEAEHLAPFIQI